MRLLLAAERAVEWGAGMVVGAFDMGSAFPGVPLALARRALQRKIVARRAF